MKRNNVKTPVCLVLSLLLIFYSALLPASAADLEVSNAVPALVSPLSTSNSIPLNAYEGTFFVKNRGLGNYMQIDNNASYTNPSEGTKIELWEFDGGVYQKWRFIHVGEGFYKIVPYSVAGTNLCIAVQEGKENVSQRALVLEEYNSSDGYMRMQWTITPQTDATYIIRPRCGNSYPESDWVMAAGNGIGSNGRNVENRTRNDSLNYKDEWYLYYTILDCWWTDSNQIAYWSYNPTIYMDARYSATDFYFSESVACALEQWESALSISIDQTFVQSEADICCYGGLRGNFVDALGRYLIEDQTVLGITQDTVIETSVANTCWGDSPVYFFQLTNAKTYLFYDIYDSIRNINCRNYLATHEIGHALGYMHHSTKRGHIMFGDYRKEDFEVENFNYTLTSEDILQLKQIYDVMR